MSKFVYSEPTFTSLGQTLHGYLWRVVAENGSTPAGSTLQPLVIMCHGLTNDHRDAPLFNEMREALLGAGISVFMFDFYGSGASPGDFADKLISVLRTNLGDALTFVSCGLDGQPPGGWSLGLFGRSYGGTVSAFYLQDERVSAAVLASPPTHLVSAMAPLYSEPKDGYVYLPFSFPPSGQKKGEYKLSQQFFEELQSLEEVLLSRRPHICPTLIAQGAQDSKVPAEQTLCFFEALPEPKEYLYIPDGNHDYDNVENLIVAAALAWFKQYLEVISS